MESYSRKSQVPPFRAFSKGRFFEQERAKFEQDVTTIALAPPKDAKPISTPTRKRKRSTPETIVEKPSQVDTLPSDVPVADKQAPSKKRKETQKTNNTNNKSPAASIEKVIQMVQDYANGSNDADFRVFESIPSLLFGVIGTHFQSDLGAMTLAIQTILKYTSSTRREINASSTSYHRQRILRELFGRSSWPKQSQWHQSILPESWVPWRHVRFHEWKLRWYRGIGCRRYQWNHP